jgi:glycosyltransferase involved in cell wall biosynthesis
MPVASVIVPARNAASTIARTLRAIADQDCEDPFEVIVVDNGSTDETGRVAADALPSASVIRKEPGGVGSARNRGVAEAQADMIAFIDSDCYPVEGWLRSGLRCLADSDLVQGAVSPDPTAARAPFDRTVSVVKETGLYETANLFVRRAMFDRIGGFDDWIVPDIEAPFGEDVWFGWEARRAGAATSFCPEALAHHEVFPRKVGDFVAERRRCEHFPALAARVPELRHAFFYRGIFLTKRSAAFDLAAVSVLAAAWRRSPWPLAGLIPYSCLTARDNAPWRRWAPRALAGDIWADAVTAAYLAKGSVRYRAPVL